MNMMRLTLLATLVFPAAACLAAEGDAATEAEMKPYTERLGKHLQFVPIPGGKFTMGSPAAEKGRKADEGPQFEAAIEPFWMGKYEVTWDDFKAFRSEFTNVPEVRAIPIPKDREADAVSIPTVTWEQEFRPILNPLGEEGGYPIADLSQFNAKQFTKWLSKKTGRFYRLPTEAEWEYAARAGTKTAYFFGDDPTLLKDYAIFFDNSEYPQDIIKGHPDFNAGYRVVGSKKPNPWGLYDIYGNVSEWVIDGYTKDHYAQHGGKSLPAMEVIDWPARIYPTVFRGGDWNAVAEGCRSASRGVSDKSFQKRDPNDPKSPWWNSDSFHIGFRVVRPLKEPSDEVKAKFWEAHSDEIKDLMTSGNAAAKQYRKVIEPLDKK